MIRLPILLLGFSLLAATAMAQQTDQQTGTDQNQKSGMGSAATQTGPLGTEGLTYDSLGDSRKSSISGLGLPSTAATQNSPMQSGSGYDDGTGFGQRKK